MGYLHAMAIPSSLDQIDAAFLSEVLSQPIRTATAERIAVGTGFLGELARITLDYEGDADGPATVIAKIPTTDGALRPVGLMLDVYQRECRAYDEVVPQLKVRTAGAFYNGFDVDAEEYCLILEDIAHMTPGDQAAGCSLDQASAAMDAAAGLHSRWWRRVEQLDWVPPIDSPLNMGLQGMVEMAWPAIVDLYADTLGPEILGHLETFLPTVSQMLTTAGPVSHTLTHNDFRLDNMFFDDGELVLIDWQLVGRGDGLGDVSPFLSMNLDIELRRAHETALLRRYFDAMSNAGAGYLHFEDLVTAYRLNLNFWLLMYAYSGTTAGETNDRSRELYQNAVSRSADAYRVNAAWELIGWDDAHDRLH